MSQYSLKTDCFPINIASISYGSDMLPSGDTAVAGVEVASSSTAATAVSVNGKNVDVGIALAKTAPRLYQAELLNKALEGNIIAVLDTGSGKVVRKLSYFGRVSLTAP